MGLVNLGELALFCKAQFDEDGGWENGVVPGVLLDDSASLSPLNDRMLSRRFRNELLLLGPGLYTTVVSLMTFESFAGLLWLLVVSVLSVVLVIGCKVCSGVVSLTLVVAAAAAAPPPLISETCSAALCASESIVPNMVL